jgi:[protein-PII] uridylyltransferase
VAVGGYGRRELAPFSDLDVVLVHADSVDASEIAAAVWYPLWDSGALVDHSVRAFSEMTRAAATDLRVAMGLLNARHLAGDPVLTLQLRSVLLAQWRREARRRLPELRGSWSPGASGPASWPTQRFPTSRSPPGACATRRSCGRCGHWLVDVPHTDLERSRRQLLDVRDALHTVAARSTDRVAPELWTDLGLALGITDGVAAQRHVRQIGSRITHLSRLTWRRVDAVLDRPRGAASRRPNLQPLAPGLAASRGEVVLDGGVDPARDPLLLLRAAALAAEGDLLLSPPTVARLVRECPRPEEPWGEDARNLLTRLLAAGPGLLPVWETLDETGALAALLPEWERVRLLPHATTVHRFTVDRHLVETCIEAARLIRTVARPDLLFVAALLHDIGKGGRGDHSTAGAALTEQIARRWGFSEPDVRLVSALVRWHLLLVDVATTRDTEDPSTVAYVLERVTEVELLDHLVTLTQADALATSPRAWTAWRAALVDGLVQRVREELTGAAGSGAPARDPVGWGDSAEQEDVEVPASVQAGADLDLRVEPNGTGGRVTVTARDRIGLLAAIAGALGGERAGVLAARAWTQDDDAISVWDVDEPALDARRVRQAVEAVLEGRLDPARRLRRGGSPRLEPSVECGLRRRARPRCSRCAPTTALGWSTACARHSRPGRIRAVGARRDPRSPGGGRVLRAGVGCGGLERRAGGERCATPYDAPSGPGYPRRLNLLAARDAARGLPPLQDLRGLTPTCSPLSPTARRHLQEPPRARAGSPRPTSTPPRGDPHRLLEADVALPWSSSSSRGQGAARGRGQPGADPAQQVIKIVNEELVTILGGETGGCASPRRRRPYHLRPPPGRRQTTWRPSCAVAQGQGSRRMLVAADLQRPNASPSSRSTGAGRVRSSPRAGQRRGRPGPSRPGSSSRRASARRRHRRHRGRLGHRRRADAAGGDIRDAVRPTRSSSSSTR